MSGDFLIIKMKKTLQTIRFAEESFEYGENRYYILNSKDQVLLRDYIGNKLPVVILVFDDLEIQRLFYGNCEIGANEVKYRIKLDTSFDMVIENFVSFIEINIQKDYDRGNYVIIENSKSVLDQLQFITDEFDNGRGVQREYEYDDIGEDLSDYAQKNIHARRLINALDPQEGRSEYQRDYERIVNSKAFRRLVDKAQVFPSSKGDHFRTRMTHSLSVNQIARGITNSLKLNPFLTEAIALGHDLGHAPFGHAGERILNEILKSDKIDSKLNVSDCALTNNEECNSFTGGFKHNYQGIRVVTKLEEMYVDFTGMDLTVQTIEGIWKHTHIKNRNCISCKDKNKSCYDIYQYIEKDLVSLLEPDQSFSFTLEGQVVAIADEIAQRGHDLDDALASKLITIEELQDSLCLKKMNSLNSKTQEIIHLYKKQIEKGRFYVDPDSVLQSRITSAVIHFFIQDVVEESKKRMGKNKPTKNNHYNTQIIAFSEEGTKLVTYLEKIVKNRVISNSEVALFDSKAENIILSLFNAYYKNPYLLHYGTVRRILCDIREVTNNVIDFQNADKQVVKKEWNRITGGLIDGLNEKEYFEKRKILIRNIVDFISGMTDTYAINEYNRICK